MTFSNALSDRNLREPQTQKLEFWLLAKTSRTRSREEGLGEKGDEEEMRRSHIVPGSGFSRTAKTPQSKAHRRHADRSAQVLRGAGNCAHALPRTESQRGRAGQGSGASSFLPTPIQQRKAASGRGKSWRRTYDQTYCAPPIAGAMGHGTLELWLA